VPTIIWHLLGVTTVDVILTSEPDSYSNSEFSDLNYSRSDQVPTIIGHYYEFITSMFFWPQMQTNTQPIFFHMTLLTVEGTLVYNLIPICLRHLLTWLISIEEEQV